LTWIIELLGGKMKVKLFIVLLIALVGLPLFAGDYKIGTGTSSEYYVPLYGNANYSWSKNMYTNAELQAQGMTTATTIKKIAFYVSNVSSYTTLNQTIYMGYNYNTSYSGFTSYPTSYTGYTQVYNGPITWIGTGWFEITLTTPYTYDPTLYMLPSLEILWENRDGTALSPYPKFNYTTSSNKCVYKSGSTYPTGSGTLYSNRPNIWLMSDPTDAPPPATAVTPLNAASGIEINTDLKWMHNGGQPDSYKVFFGSDNPPSNIIAGEDVTTISYDLVGYLNYATTYYWRIVPHNSFGYAMDCPVWSFTTRNDPTIYSFPWTETFDGTFPSTNWEMHAGILTSPMVFGVDNLCKWEQDDWLNITGIDKAAKLELQFSDYTGWLVTPPLNITSDLFQLQFDLAFLKWNNTPTGTPPTTNGTDDRFVVLIGDGFSWSPANILREWNNTGSPYVLNNIAIAGERITIPIPFSRSHQRIAFYAGSTVMNADNDLMINNVAVNEFLQSPVVDMTVDTDVGEVKLSWSIVPEAVNYLIYAAASPNGTYSQIGSTNDTQFVITGLDIKRFFKVIASTVTE
jgi:hypothetical protein